MYATALMTPERSLDAIQEKAVTYQYEHDYTLLNVPVGFGKTIVSLTAAQELIRDGVLRRVLVLAPLSVAQFTWGIEGEHWPHIDESQIGICTGTPAQRLNIMLDHRFTVVVLNFENVAWFFKQFGDNHTFDGLIIDELTKLSEVGGVAFKALRNRAPKFKWRVGMTATPVAEGLEKLYGMVLLLDGGAALGRSKDRFLNTYFYPTDYERRRWAPKAGTSEALARAVMPFTFSVPDNKYADSLPELVEDYVYTTMAEGTRVVYDDLRRNLLVETEGGVIVAKNMAALSGKFQQLCSGFAYDTEKRAVVYDRERLDTAFAVAMTGKQGAVLVYQYKEELAYYSALAKEHGLNVAVLGNGVGRPAGIAAIEAWNAGKLDLLLLHPNSGGHGLNLQTGGDLIVWGGALWSRDKTDQVIGRLRRRGSPHSVITVVRVLVRDTVEDKVILPRVKGKGDAQALFKQHLCEVAD